VDKLDDQVLKVQLKQTRSHLEEDWKNITDLFKKEKLLNSEATHSDFKRAVNFLYSRCFGHNCAVQMLVPLADNCNHASSSLVDWQLVNK
jgi:hypothetical protein